MKKIYLFSVAIAAAMLLAACHSDHDHEGQNHEGETHEGEGHDAAHTGEIHFSDAQAKTAGLQLYEVQPTAFSELIEVSGRLLPAQGSEATEKVTLILSMLSARADTACAACPQSTHRR